MRPGRPLTALGSSTNRIGLRADAIVQYAVRYLLMRHARPIPDSYERSDEARWLTEHGRRDAREMGAALAQRGEAFDAAVSSPLVRAVQTAELCCAGAGYAGVITVLEDLAPSGSPRRAQEELDTLGAVVLVVSHEPFISALANHLLGARAVEGFTPGEIIAIEAGEVTWRMAPV